MTRDLPDKRIAAFQAWPMPSQHSFLDKMIEKSSNSWDFTISFVLHLLLILIFGTTVLFKVVQQPPDFEGDPAGFVPEQQQMTLPPPPQQTRQQEQFNVNSMVPPPTSSSPAAITTVAPSAMDFPMNVVMPAPNPNLAPPSTMTLAPSTAPAPDTMSTEQKSAIRAFTSGWVSKGGYNGARSTEFNFVAYIGQYEGGNWDSTVQVTNSQITMGSLPNLLYFMSANSANKIKTNYKAVKAIRLDSDEIFTTKPPFIFFTGTKNFVLSDHEVANLQKYIELGGCIWGDSSVPGARSSFDIAFRREMKRVLPDVDKKFEPLPPDHPIYADGYFNDIRGVPSGLNYYQESVYALKIHGEIAILYTANDYGDMWQIGLDQKNQVDLRQNEQHQWIAINMELYRQRGIYCKNLELPSLIDSYKFGTNVVIHLLMRWEDKVRNAPSTTPL